MALLGAEHARALEHAEAIRARRRRLGLTLKALADKSALSSPFLSQVERIQATPSIKSLMAIARALDVDIHYFIDPPPHSEVVRRAADPEYLDRAQAARSRVRKMTNGTVQRTSAQPTPTKAARRSGAGMTAPTTPTATLD